jgi:2-oxoglutarate dehydrogenase E1 component
MEPLLDLLARDFGVNVPLALDLLERFRADPGSLDPAWRAYFERIDGSPAPVPGPARGAAPPAAVPGGRVLPIRGGASRIVENMEASLALPTATSGREMPVRTLEENRSILNRHRERTLQPKISFTHIAAWAVLRALERHPRMNDAYAEVEGQPCRIQPDAVRLGIAVDVQRKDGSRTLLVPNLKGAQELPFAAFLEAFDRLVQRARNGSCGPDDFMGTTLTLTNPGTLGTTWSVPRLLQGQGLILVTGALDHPAEYRSMAPRTLSHLGISRVMTLTCTYDHRIIQGAESGQFLATLEELLRGDGDFYERIFQELGVAYPPVRWERDSDLPLASAGGSEEVQKKQARVLELIRTYRVRGHLVASVDPLRQGQEGFPELDPAFHGFTLWDLDRDYFTNGLSGQERATLRAIMEVLRETYCGNVGVEYMFIQEPERRAWLQQRLEAPAAPPSAETRRRILEKLVEAEAFERFLHAKYIGHKRFSLEGGEALIALLDQVLSRAAEAGMEAAVIGMSHRGRLNVLANTVGKPLAHIFAVFEGDVDPDTVQGSGDVVYHLGAEGVHQAPGGARMDVRVCANPSHLEIVDPVVEGLVRALQDAAGDTRRQRFLPILVHGDAAFAGQGVVAETLNLAGLHGYRTGGTVHVVVNNQIGFTTLPRDARSSTYCTDVARMVQAPIFHVNGDDPEALVRVGLLALDYRQAFGRDVVIDMVGYRRWGHNEGDEPAYTQPLMYARIKEHPSVARLYGEALVRAGRVGQEELEGLWSAKKAQMNAEGAAPAPGRPRPPAEAGEGAAPAPGRIQEVLRGLTQVPEGFQVHPKLAPFLQKRAELGAGRGELDWSTAEALAFGTLAQEGISLRLSGQDVGRGTFSQRHAVLYDWRTGAEHCPLKALAAPPARFEVYDSMLSEAAVLGFEYGNSLIGGPRLILWEAQFGDFANGAQVVIDQFIAASERKWDQASSLVLLLPHGLEGQGPEHSSARLERFLQLCAEDNLRVACPSTPASYYRLLRAQARAARKPLVVMTPKSLLRHPGCISPLAEFADDRFQPLLDDPGADPAQVAQVLLCSGKVYYDLAKRRQERDARGVALVRLERLYPFPAAELRALLARYPSAADFRWVQEEPRNQGAWQFVRARLLEREDTAQLGRALGYAGRPESAAPATGSHRAHQQELEALLDQAFQHRQDPLPTRAGHER